MTQSRTRQGAPDRKSLVIRPTDTALLEGWALAQDDAFSADEAVTGAAQRGSSTLARGAVTHHLSTHPSVTGTADAYITPRVLARRGSFLIRLLPVEREQGLLIPGHRFVPFMSLDGDPDELVPVLPDGSRLRRITVEIDRDMAESCVTLLGHRGSLALRATRHPRGRVLVNAFRLEAPLVNGTGAPEELLVTCLDFEARLYRLERAPASATHGREADLKRLVKALTFVVQHPPTGPVECRRQLLQAVARALRDFSGRPIPPLSLLLDPAADLMLDQQGGDARFVSRSAPAKGGRGAARTATDLDGIVEAMERMLRTVPRRLLNDGADYRLQIAGFHWNPAERCFRGAIQDGDPTPCHLCLTVQAERQEIELDCSCPLHTPYTPCKHIAAALQELVRMLRLPGHPLVEEVRAGTTLRPWKQRLLRLDGILHAHSTVTPLGDAIRTRINWRIADEPETFALTPYLQKSRKGGAWSTGQKIALARIASGEEAWMLPADQEVARVLLPQGPPIYTASAFSSATPSVDAFDVISRLIEHPSISWESEPEALACVEAVELRLRLEHRAAGELALLLGAGKLDAGRTTRVFPCRHGLVLIDKAARRIALVRADRRNTALAREILAGEAVFPTDALPDLLARIPALEEALPVDLPPELVDEEIAADRRIHLLLTPERPTGLRIAMRVRPLPGGRSLRVPGSRPEVLSEFAGGRKRVARRDLSGEIVRARALAEQFGITRFLEDDPWQWRVATDDEALDLLTALQAQPSDDFLVEWPEDGRRMFVVGEASPTALRVRIDDRRDWFGVSGEIEMEGEKIGLGQVLDSLRQGHKYVPVGEGKWIRISQMLQDRLMALVDIAHETREDLEIGPTAVPMLKDALVDIGAIEASTGWNALVQRFESTLTYTPKPPASFCGELREYQLDGYCWMQRLAAWGVGGCLADDMGLGKTVQALAVMADRAGRGPTLVIAPTSVGTNWVEECRRFCPGLQPILYRETDRDTALETFGAGNVVVVSYGLVLRDIAKLSKVPWSTLILDEAQFIKNSRTKTAQAIRDLDSEWRLALTGTPIENHLGELWSLFRAVSPGLFGSWDRFREQFALPIERDRMGSRRRALAAIVRPFILRRTKGEVLSELPPRTEVMLSAELSPPERKLYDDARLAALVRLMPTTQSDEAVRDRRFQVLAALTELRQLACHARLIHPELGIESAKMRVFLELIDELRAGGHKALVFSQFTRHLALVREELDLRKVPYQYLDGGTPPKQRDKVVQAFQRGEGDLFLISLKAGGTGLNLTAADYVIHMDPWWNPAVEDQATDRAHRIGQSRAVMVYRIVATGTIEEQILALHADKRTLVSDVLEGTDVAGRMSTEELVDLIRTGSAPVAEPEPALEEETDAPGETEEE